MISGHSKSKIKLSQKFGRYLLYATGEIILVVIGILIALYINNESDLRKRKIQELNYLDNLMADIASDSIYYERSWFKRTPKKISVLINAKEYYKTKQIKQDTIEFINDVSYGGIYGVGQLSSNTRTYNELLSTGNLSLIEDQNLRKRITNYYLDQSFLTNYAKNLQGNYAKYVNAFKPFNPAYPDSIDKSDIPIMLKMMQKDEFFSLINSELTYTYSVIDWLKSMKRESHMLSEQIKTYIEKE